LPKDPLGFIKDNFKKASSQFKHQWDEANNKPLDYQGKRRVVLNMTYRDVAIDEVFKQRVLEEASSQHIDEVLIITKSESFGVGEILRLK